MYDSGVEWAQDEGYWSQDNLYETAMFVGERMLDTVGTSGHRCPEQEPMVNALMALRIASVDRIKGDDLYVLLHDIYVESFKIAFIALNIQFGIWKTHEWMPTFRGYQDTLASMIQYLHQKKQQLLRQEKKVRVTKKY